MKNPFLLLTIAFFIIAMSTVAQVSGTFTDSRDGKIYKTVKIGTQTWMTENLAFHSSSFIKEDNWTATLAEIKKGVTRDSLLYKVSALNNTQEIWLLCTEKISNTNSYMNDSNFYQYSFAGYNQNSEFIDIIATWVPYLSGQIYYDGREIGKASSIDSAGAKIVAYSSNLQPKTIPDCVAYNYDENNTKEHGYLYTWEEAKIACPKGWHIPSDAEWSALNDFLGGQELAANKMKTITGWLANGNGNNSSGFSGLPGGSRTRKNDFNYLNEFGSWWSSSEDESGYVWTRDLYYESDKLIRGVNDKKDGLSVRCIKD